MTRAAKILGCDIRIDRASAEPLRVQILQQLRRAILDAPAGARLASTRALAARLSVSRNTVLEAYDSLVAEGLVTGRHGSGTRVGGVARATKAKLSARELLRSAQYPAKSVELRDPEGNPVYLAR